MSAVVAMYHYSLKTGTSGASWVIKNGFAVGGSFWASQDTAQEIAWTLLTNATQVNAFANLLDTIARPSSAALGGSSTCISCGMAFGINAIQTNAFFTAAGALPIIDVSGDGIQNINQSPNTGTNYIPQVEAQRNLASSFGIRINGITIGNDGGVAAYYPAHVITPTGFSLAASGFNTFSTAISTKIQQEVAPVPGPLPILGAFAAFGFSRKLRRRIRTSQVQ